MLTLAASRASTVQLAPAALCGSCAPVKCRLHLEAGPCLRLAPGRLLWRRGWLAALARSSRRRLRRLLHEDHVVLPPLHHRRVLVDLL